MLLMRSSVEDLIVEDVVDTSGTEKWIVDFVSYIYVFEFVLIQQNIFRLHKYYVYISRRV